MRSTLTTTLGLMIAVGLVGCRGGGFGSVSQRPGYGSEPPLVVGSADGAAEGRTGPSVVAQSSPTFVDRHPLLAKPRDLYDSTNGNTLVKTGSAVLVGVPTGLFGELRQVFVGAPPANAALPPAGPTR